MPVPPNQPPQRPSNVVTAQNIQRIPLEQFDVKSLSGNCSGSEIYRQQIKLLKR